ncbi:MAG: ATP-binding protein [Alphaproteobacteria bacterium]|nr:ATP-binding protein [Alphaproteobacteria bacterium]
MIRRLRPNNLLFRTLIGVLPATMLALFCIWIVATTVIRSSLQAEFDRKLAQEAFHASATVETALESVLRTARGLARNDLVLRNLGGAARRLEDLQALFQSLRLPNALGARISLTDARGQRLASNFIGRIQSNDDWLAATAQNREFLRISENGMTVAVPVSSAGPAVGAVVVEYSRSDLEELLNIPRAASAFALSTDSGIVVFSSDRDFAQPGQAIDGSAMRGWVSKSAVVLGFPTLSIIVAESETVAMAPLAKLQLHMLIIIVLSIVATVTGIVAAAVRATGPVSRFVESIRYIRETGDLEHRIEPDGSDEFRAFAEAFNEMLDRLRSTLVSLDIVADANNALKHENAARKRAECSLEAQTAELKRSNAELEQFAYVASHDLKAPLRAINSIATWIEEDLENLMDEQTRDNLDILRGRVARMERLLTDLLEYSRVGRSAERIDIVDTGSLVANVFAMLGAPDGFTLRCTTPMPTFMTACVPLEQTFHNLMGNALKHHDRAQGSITIAAGPAGDFYEFSVTDDGPGIDPKYHRRIFEMFQTLQPRDDVEGSGMGLALVRKIIESNGGTIRIEAAPGERGSRFVFTWPKEWTSQSGGKAAA